MWFERLCFSFSVYVWCLKVQSKDFRRRNLFGKVNTWLRTTIVEKITQQALFSLKSYPGQAAAFGTRCVGDVFSRGIFCPRRFFREYIYIYICPDLENLFVVIVSRSRLDSEGFPVLQLTDKDTLHRPIQHGWTDLPVPPPLEIVLIFLSRLGWPRHRKTCRSRRELDNQGT